MTLGLPCQCRHLPCHLSTLMSVSYGQHLSIKNRIILGCLNTEWIHCFILEFCSCTMKQWHIVDQYIFNVKCKTQLNNSTMSVTTHTHSDVMKVDDFISTSDLLERKKTIRNRNISEKGLLWSYFHWKHKNYQRPLRSPSATAGYLIRHLCFQQTQCKLLLAGRPAQAPSGERCGGAQGIKRGNLSRGLLGKAW